MRLMATADAAGLAGQPGAREEPRTQGCYHEGWRKVGAGSGRTCICKTRAEHPGVLCLEEGSWESVASCLGTRLWLQTGLGMGVGRLRIAS